MSEQKPRMHVDIFKGEGRYAVEPMIRNTGQWHKSNKI